MDKKYFMTQLKNKNQEILKETNKFRKNIEEI